MVVPAPVQHQIALKAPLVAYVPTRLAIGWLAGNKVYWSQTATAQQAWRCVNGMKLVAATSLAPDRFADVGLGRVVASGHRIR